MNDSSDNAAKVKALITEGTIYGGAAVIALVFLGYVALKS